MWNPFCKRGFQREVISIISDITGSANSLTSPSIPFHSVTSFGLQKSQLDAIENLKTLVTSAPCLKIFDSKLPTRLKTDASSVGLVAVLEQTYGTVDNEK